MIALVVIAVLVVGALVWMIAMPGESWRGDLPPLTDDETRLAAALEKHVRRLASTIGERNSRVRTGLESAVAWVRDELQGAGCEVEVHSFEAGGETFENVEARLPGSGDAGSLVVVGAHYDSVAYCPAANDNGSGVAAGQTLGHPGRLLPTGL